MVFLHNLYVIHGDEFDLNWAKSAEENTKKISPESFCDLRNADMFYVLEASIAEMRKAQKQVVQVEFTDLVKNNTINLDILESKEKVE
jgi:hypothetical protein